MLDGINRCVHILDICPDTKVRAYAVFFLPENADTFDFSEYDYVIDAVSGKIAIIEKAKTSEKSRTPYP